MKLRDKLKSVKHFTTKTVHVPLWDLDVNFRTWTAQERLDVCERFKLLDQNKDDSAAAFHLMVDVVAMSLVEEDGSPVFSQDNVAELRQCSVEAIDFCFAEAMKANGMSQKAVEEAKKN